MDDCRFKGFSGLAVLYAQHVSLVRRISGAFHADIASFLDDLRMRTAWLLRPDDLAERVTLEEIREWSLMPADPMDARGNIFIRIDAQRPEIVSPGELRFELCCPIMNDCNLREYVLRYGMDADPVESAARQLAEVFTLLQGSAASHRNC